MNNHNLRLLGEILTEEVPFSIAEISAISGISIEDINEYFAVIGYSIEQVMLVVTAAKALIGVDRVCCTGKNSPGNTFLRLVTRIILHTEISIKDVAIILNRNRYETRIEEADLIKACEIIETNIGMLVRPFMMAIGTGSEVKTSEHFKFLVTKVRDLNDCKSEGTIT